ncbi:MAG: AmmeMemoRadiSam system protein B [Bacteroidales bacterium]|nr:AmmeMemoRadiSam system protein B [Bacteroidales bacterium]
MHYFLKIVVFMSLTFNFHQGCNGEGTAPPHDRKPVAAGRFYPGDYETLQTTLKELFSKARTMPRQSVPAIIVPHAGYVFSGQVAASGFNQIDPDKEYENVFVIGSSHQVSFNGASIYNQGDYVTPLGTVNVNVTLANQLIHDFPVFSYHPEAEQSEHCLEVEVPFLQYHLKKPFKLVPVIIGTQHKETCKIIAEALKPFFNDKNLFVFSTDFSHYPAYNDAIKTDQATCDAILTKSPEKLVQFLHDYEQKKIPNLATNLCGWTSILVLLNMISNNPNIAITPVQYMNSGDSKYGDTMKVVGYWSLALVKKTAKVPPVEDFTFTTDEQQILLKIARNTLEKYMGTQRILEIDSVGFSKHLTQQAGAFVTLKKKGELRGCIGRFTANTPLFRVIQEMVIASATEDTRFPLVTLSEVDDLVIEISVLSPMKKIKSPEDIILGKHGIYIKQGYHSGTFLPQVAAETGWSKEEFLGHCARDKAGLGWEGWKTADIFVYEAFVFSEPEHHR